jgi:hypothetical protein
MFALRRSLVLRPLSVAPRQFSTIEERERTFENQAVRKHDAELLKKLAENLPKPVNRVSVVGAGLMGTGWSNYHQFSVITYVVRRFVRFNTVRFFYCERFCVR